MEIIIDKDCFNKAISEVSKAVSTKALLPILSGIKIVANRDNLTLVGSSSEIVIEKVIPLIIENEKVLEVIEPGSVVISAKYLEEIVKKLHKKIYIKVNQQSVTIQSEEIVINFNGFNSEEYPISPKIETTKCISISSEELISIIKQTTFAVSKNQSRPVLTGLNISISENLLTFVATNSQRLSLRKLESKQSLNGSFIIPGTSLNELAKIIHNESASIHIYFSKNYIVFKFDTITYFSNLIEGTYPNTLGLFPKDAKTVIVLNTKQLLKGIDRACLFSSEWKNNNVNLEIIKGPKIRISSNGSEIGKIEETQGIKEITGETDLRISFDAIFLMDALKAIDEDDVRISFGGTMIPALIEPVNNSSFVQLISPVRTY